MVPRLSEVEKLSKTPVLDSFEYLKICRCEDGSSLRPEIQNECFENVIKYVFSLTSWTKGLVELLRVYIDREKESIQLNSFFMAFDLGN